MNKELAIINKIKDDLDLKINNLKEEFESPNSTSFGEMKDYGHIATRMVILQECLKDIKWTEEWVEENWDAKEQCIS